MKINELFNNISKELGLGNVLKPPEKLTGGFMHKMFRLDTECGVYAIKLLNPIIMNRSDAFDNFKNAEMLEHLLEDAHIPIMPALTFNGKKMQCTKNQYYYIFNWFDGKALKSQEIKKENCIMIGNILAKIHNIEYKSENVKIIENNKKAEQVIAEIGENGQAETSNAKESNLHKMQSSEIIENYIAKESSLSEVQSNKKAETSNAIKSNLSEALSNKKAETSSAKESNLHKDNNIESVEKNNNYENNAINWDYYIKIASINCQEIATLLIEKTVLLDNIQNEVNSVINKLPNATCICHGDMDSKNVLWRNNVPIIIDLECLHYGNPFMELLELALSWSGLEHFKLNFELMESFIEAYIKESKIIQAHQIDWNILCCVNNGKLHWLEYNIKRALMIECGSEEEHKQGIAQVKYTIDLLLYFDEVKLKLIEKLQAKAKLRQN